MQLLGKILLGSLCVLSQCQLVACGKREAPVETHQTSPVAPVAASPTAASIDFSIETTGSADFLIDAPLEKIKGVASGFRGSFQLVASDIAATRGEVDVDLESLRTHTFSDAEQNTAQTEHAHSWLGLAPDIKAKNRTENQWARFTIRNIVSSDAPNMALAKKLDNQTLVELTAEGDLWLNGVNSSKQVRMLVAFDGPPSAPTHATIKTLEPLRVSLKEHDIKPRDLTGKILQGALEKIGQKIDDQVQITLSFGAGPAGAGIAASAAELHANN